MKNETVMITVFCVLLGTSCITDTETEPPPFVIGKPVSVAGNREGYYKFAGVEFTFYNSSDKNVSGMSVSMMVYDRVTNKTPFIGSNNIKANFDGGIAAGEEKLFIISLDPYIYAAPGNPYIIDFFYILRVVFGDGSEWVDRNGTYHTRSD
jgi:hypothetical protein